MLNEIYKELEGCDTIHDFADAVVTVRLRAVKDMYITEVEYLTNEEQLTDWQKKDFEELTNDVAALKRVIGLFTVSGDDDEL